jgi:carboxylesterase type B
MLLSAANIVQWTIKNIASFGGDPYQITIIGESAGAGSVRVLLGSPPAKGKFNGAVAMSNLGGGVDLGLSGNYATTYSSYLSVPESYALAGQNIFLAAGCTQTSLEAQIACLELVPAWKLVGLSSVARYVVQDGTYVNTEELDVVNRNGSTAHVDVMFGITANDGASFSTYPKTPVTTELAGIQAALGISASYAQSIIDSGLFPLFNTGNITLDSFNVSQRVATDNQFRCIDQATMYAGSKSGAFRSSFYYQMQRTINGYDPNNLGGPPASPGYPNGNPNLPYFRLHGSDMPWVFGTIGTLRDANDLYSVQLSTAYFAEFVKSGQPNPSTNYLRARGYTKTLEAIQKTGSWEEVSGTKGPIKLLDYPAVTSPFLDLPQCAFLNYPTSYYLDGGK